MRATEPIIEFGRFRYLGENRELNRDGRKLRVPLRSLILLECLLERPGRLVTRQELLAAGWPDTHVTASSLTEAMSRLRGALGDDVRRPRYVETLAGRGYRFIATVHVPTARRRWLALAAGLLLAAGAGLAWLGSGAPATAPRIAEIAGDGELIEELPLPRLAIRDLAPSPDGRLLAFTVGPSLAGDIWVFDRSSRVLARLSEGGANSEATWSPNGEWVAWAHRQESSFDLVRRRADGTGRIEILLSAPGDQFPEGWAADGRLLVYSEAGADGDLDLSVLELEAGGWRSRSLRATRHHEYLGSFSPDGHWLAFASDASGAFEVYVQGASTSTDPVRVSRRGASDPFWSADGRTLYFLEGGRLMRLPVTPDFPERIEPERVLGVDGVLRARATPGGGFLAALRSDA